MTTFVGLWALAAAPLLPQAPVTRTDQRVLRAGTTRVPVDVRVAGRNGVPITDLRESNFTILDDGVPEDGRTTMIEPELLS